MSLRWFNVILLVLALVSASAGVVLAKRQPRPPDIATVWKGEQSAASGNTRAAMSGMAEFRTQHKFTFQLLKVANGLPRLAMGRTALEPDQAKALLKLLQPLRTQPTLTQDEAKQTMSGVQQILTIEQRTAVMQSSSSGRRRRGGGGFSGGMPGAGQPGPAPGMAPGATPGAAPGAAPGATPGATPGTGQPAQGNTRRNANPFANMKKNFNPFLKPEGDETDVTARIYEALEAAAKATPPTGFNPGGFTPNGTRPEGIRPQGNRPEGTRPEGTRPEGNRPEGTRPEGTRP